MSNVGRKQAPGVYICQKCGHSIPVEELLAIRHCPKCGSKDIDVRAYTDKVICDFCGVEDPEWAYDTKPFVAEQIDPALPEANMDRGWATCAACADLIDALDQEGLTQRSVDLYEERYGKVPDFLQKNMRKWKDRLHKQFFQVLRSERIPAPDYPAWIEKHPFDRIIRGTPQPLPSLSTDRGRPWIEVIRLRTELLRFYEDRIATRYLKGFAEANGLAPSNDPEWLANYFRQNLEAAITFWVSEDMTALAEAAAERSDLQRTVLDVEDIPCPEGFVVFERSFLMHDTRGRQMSFRAVAWKLTVIKIGDAGEDQLGVMLHFYTDRREPLDDVNQQVQDRYPQGGLTLTLQLSHLTTWAIGQSWVHEQDQGDYDQQEAARMLRFIWSFWHISQQPKTATTTTATPDRATRRQAQRSSPNIDTDVQVITLRRKRKPEHATQNGDHRNYSHRFIVSGHWRNQWYPASQKHKPKYIDDYVKGPDDQPLIIKHKIYKWTR